MRMNFGFTTLEKLLRAKEIGQLFGITPLEKIMHSELHKNGIKNSRQYCVMKNGRCRYRLDFAVFCKKGRIDVECDNEKWHYQPGRKLRDSIRNRWLKARGWKVLRFSGARITANPQSCIRKIKQTIRSLGGLCNP